MTDIITAGSILVEDGAHLTKSLQLQSGSDSNGWTTLDGALGTFEKTIESEGSTFFFMAGQIKTCVFGFDRQKALRGALKRLIAIVKSQHCNSIEITRVTGKSFLGVPYVSVSAYPRRLQKGMLFSGNGPVPGPEFVLETKSKWS